MAPGVRRSNRRVGASVLYMPRTRRLLEQIRTDAPEVEVLRLHHYLGPGVGTVVIDAVLDALVVNSNCQALYIQNFNDGFGDKQLLALAKVLEVGNIWCLNAGENYGVSLAAWWDFAKQLQQTKVTHAYISDHVIPSELKHAMRKSIRDNRCKHTRHSKASNIHVIRQCKNMWWNPINSRALQNELRPEAVSES